MADTFGEALRGLRLAAGHSSLRAFARSARITASQLSRVETGERPPSMELAIQCDRALGTTPLLLELLAYEGDPVRRREALARITGLTTAALAGTVSLPESIRRGLLDAADAAEDLEQIVADFGERLVTDASPAYGEGLLGRIYTVRQQLKKDPSNRDLLRAAAGLSEHYGLWQGNQGDLAGARGWYRTAALCADRSHDTATRVWVRGRTLSRATYEGTTIRQTILGAENVLGISRKPSPGVLEAHAARVHAHAIAGDLDRGRAAVADMWATAERIADLTDGPVGPMERTASFASYLECRAGALDDAEAAYAEARTALAHVPLWAADARIYYGRALVRHGAVEDGLGEALAAVRSLTADVRVVRIGVRDVLTVVPTGYRSDQLDELAAYAGDVRGPWEEGTGS